MRKISFAGRKVPVPGHPILRLVLGILLIIGGSLGFLPVLGFWMIPLGLLVLAVDFPIALRLKRKLDVVVGRWLKRYSPKWAKRFGYTVGNDGNPVG